MLDHIAVGPLLEHPARKDAIPFVVALVLDGQLNEGAGFGRRFPRRGRLARAQAHDRAADARRVAGLHLQLLNDAVALVEQAEHRDAIFHRRRALDPADLARDVAAAFDRGRLRCAAAFAAAPVAAGQEARGDECGERENGRARHRAAHSAPGRQAS